MGFLERLFGYKKYIGNKNCKSACREDSLREPQNENCRKLLEMQAKIQALLEEDFYIAKSDYAGITEAYAEMIHFFEVMENSGMLPDFCVRNGMAEKEVRMLMEQYLHIENYIEAHNDTYIYQMP